MNLEDLNRQYLLFKRLLESTKNELTRDETIAARLAGDKKIIEGEIETAKRYGDTAREEQLKKDLQKVISDLQKVKNSMDRKRADLKDLSAQINERVNACRENPEVQEYLNQAISKSTQRQIAKKEKEIKEKENQKAKLDEQKEKLDAIKQLANGGHTSNFLIGMVAADQEIKKIKAEIESLKDPHDPDKFLDPSKVASLKAKLPALNKKFDQNKASLMGVIKKRKIKLTEKDIKDMLLDKAVLDKNGKISFSKTLNPQVAEINKKQLALEKEIEKGKKTLSVLSTVHDKTQKSGEEQEQEEPEDKPKPWQLVKRFKNWLARKKQAKLADEFEHDDEEEAPAGPAEDETEREESANEFKKSLKYAIIGETVKQAQREAMKQAKREINSRPSDEQPEQDDEDREP